MHNCFCCGDITYGDEPLCDLCNLAGCESTKAADGEWGYWRCQREDIDDDDGAWWLWE